MWISEKTSEPNFSHLFKHMFQRKKWKRNRFHLARLSVMQSMTGPLTRPEIGVSLQFLRLSGHSTGPVLSFLHIFYHVSSRLVNQMMRQKLAAPERMIGCI